MSAMDHEALLFLKMNYEFGKLNTADQAYQILETATVVVIAAS